MWALLLKYGLPVLGAAALLFGVYEYGHSNGYNSGYQTAWNKQQATIQAMNDKENAQTVAQNKQIDDLVKKSQQDTIDLAAANIKASLARGTVTTQYIHDNPQIAQSCGWDLPTVDAINAIIDSDPVNAVANQQLPDASISASGASAPVAASGVSQ